MKALDAIAALIVGFSILIITLRGNVPKLVTLARRDVGFLKWAIALAAFGFLRQYKISKGPMDMLMTAAVLGFFLGNFNNIQTNIKKLWN